MSRPKSNKKLAVNKKLTAEPSEILLYDKYIACVELYKLIIRQLPSFVQKSDCSLRYIAQQLNTDEQFYYRKFKNNTLPPDAIQSTLLFLRQNLKKNKKFSSKVINTTFRRGKKSN